MNVEKETVEKKVFVNVKEPAAVEVVFESIHYWIRYCEDEWWKWVYPYTARYLITPKRK